MKLTKLSAAPLPGWRCRLMPAPARMDAGTASQLIRGVRRTMEAGVRPSGTSAALLVIGLAACATVRHSGRRRSQLPRECRIVTLESLGGIGVERRASGGGGRVVGRMHRSRTVRCASRGRRHLVGTLRQQDRRACVEHRQRGSDLASRFTRSRCRHRFELLTLRRGSVRRGCDGHARHQQDALHCVATSVACCARCLSRVGACVRSRRSGELALQPAMWGERCCRTSG